MGQTCFQLLTKKIEKYLLTKLKIVSMENSFPFFSKEWASVISNFSQIKTESKTKIETKSIHVSVSLSIYYLEIVT